MKRQAWNLALDKHLVNGSYTSSYFPSINIRGVSTIYRCVSGPEDVTLSKDKRGP